MPGRRNRLGLTYASGTLVGDVIRRVRIDPAKRPCVVRVDWMRLRCLRSAADETLVLDYSTPEAIDGLTMRGMRSDRARARTGSRATTRTSSSTCASSPGAEVHTVHVECGLAVLPVPAAGVRGAATAPRPRLRDRAKRSRLAGPLRAGYALLRRFG